MEEVSPSAMLFPEGVDWLLYILIVIIILFLLGGIFYFGHWFRGKKGSTTTSKSPTNSERLMIEMDEFAKKGEYRLAIKSCFHFLLNQLMETKNLFFPETKTNGEYRQDFMKKDPNRARLFHDLTMYFDEVWYGQKKVGEEEYLQYRRNVLGFLSEVESNEKR